jgi:uncharacterized protein
VYTGCSFLVWEGVPKGELPGLDGAGREPGGAVRQKLKALALLQEVDVQILELTKSGEGHPKRIAELEAQLAQTRAAIAVERARQEENDRLRHELEQKLQEEKDKVRKWEARLTEMRTTREYAALSREVDIAKKSNQNMQEEMLALMQTGEEIEKALQARRDEAKAKEASIAEEMKELREKMSAIQAGVKELESKRTELAKSVDATLLRKYDAIRAKRGIALVPVVNGTCQGCHINIPPQLYNTVVQFKSVETCPRCNRILFLREALDGA